MSNKKFYFITAFIAILIIVFSYKVFSGAKNKEITEETKTTIEMCDKILKSNNSKKCTVNQEEITDRDIVLTKIFNQENNKEKEKTIEKVVLLQEINKKNIKLEAKESQYIEEIIAGLMIDSTINERYSENEKSEILSIISKKLRKDALVNQFKNQIIQEISSKTFNPDSENISNEYKEYLKIQEKWNNHENISYSELLQAKDNFMEAYIQELVSKAVIEWVLYIDTRIKSRMGANVSELGW